MKYDKVPMKELFVWLKNWKRRYDKLERFELMPEQNKGAKLRQELRMRMVNIHMIVTSVKPNYPKGGI